MRKAFFCEVCGAEVRCPECGRPFRGIRCPRCGKEGSADDFRSGCPDCGYSAPPPREPLQRAARPRRPVRRRERPAAFYWTLSVVVLIILGVLLVFWLR